MRAQDVLTEATKIVAVEMRKRGYKCRRRTFYTVGPDGLVLAMNIQCTTRSTKEKLGYDVRYGAFSSSIGRLFRDTDWTSILSYITSSHESGSLGSQIGVYWYWVHATDDPRVAAKVLLCNLEQSIELSAAWSTDQKLLEYSRERFCRHKEFNSVDFRNYAALMVALGRRSEIDALLDEARGAPRLNGWAKNVLSCLDAATRQV